MKYNVVACGGTFDYLHKGHQAFLEFAFSIGKKVLIGLTTETFVRQHKKQTTHSFAARKQMLGTFLKEKDFLKRAEIIPISTVYGFALDESLSINAIVVTNETKANAEMINQKREKKHLPFLSIITMSFVTQDHHIISSSAIRKGNMDTQGNIFINPAVFSEKYQLPENLRSTLQKPFGNLIQNMTSIQELDPGKIVTVGDVTTIRFHEYGIRPKISVIDFVIERKKSHQTLAELGFDGSEEIMQVVNPAGVIMPQTWKTITDIHARLQEKKRFIIPVTGEEDLLVIPLVLLLPLGFYVFYGQPHEGLVKIAITLDMKQTMQKIFTKFTPVTTRGY